MLLLLNSIQQNFKADITLLRIPFSIFLMPIFWFAMSVTKVPMDANAVLTFIIIHLFVYPASNGYNSYFDKDTQSIGGLETPPEVKPSLFFWVVLFDVLAVVLALFISIPFSIQILVYLLVSKAYSYDKIRLKKYPFISTLVVVVFQGAFVFWMVQTALKDIHFTFSNTTNLGMALVSTLFLCGSYPLTQVYQHKEDKERGDTTLSLKLGLNGTFIFSTIFLFLATGLYVFVNFISENYLAIAIYLIVTMPVGGFFVSWWKKVNLSINEASFSNAMKMNKISSICTSITFISIYLVEVYF